MVRPSFESIDSSRSLPLQHKETRVGVYPGSFNPPTTAHLAIAAAARDRHHLDRVDLVVSLAALAKLEVAHPRFEDRMAVLEQAAAEEPWLGVHVTELQLLVDIADGYDALIMGADKWLQIQDPTWYGDSRTARDEALAALPPVAIAPRDGLATPEELTLQIPRRLTADISSTAARDGNLELMLPAARRFAEISGAWIDPPAYDAWLANQQQNR